MSDTKKNTGFRFMKPLSSLHLDGDPSATIVLYFLCMVANNDTGKSKHGRRSISYATGLSTKTIQRATERLVKLGVISSEVRGRDIANRYTVHYRTLQELAEQGKAGRDEFMLALREQEAVRKRKLRSRSSKETLVPVTTTGTKEVETNSVPVKSTVCPGQTDVSVPVKSTVCPGHGDLGTTLLTPNRTTKELGKSKPSFEKQNPLVSFQESETNHDKVNPTPTPKEERRLPKVELTPKQKGLITQIKQIEEQRSKAKHDPWEYVRLEKQHYQLMEELRRGA